MTAAAEHETKSCPKCGAAASGKFCGDCGATLGAADCASCGAGLITGARFCHRCGLPVGVAPPPTDRRPGSAMSLPWIVAAITLLAFIALVAGQKFGANRPPADASLSSTAGEMPVGRAPDISQMSPPERARRLHERIMVLQESGKQDSVRMFAPMAIAAFEMLDSLDDGSRFDIGMIGWASQNAEHAGAHADTILRNNPNHLLGLILAARAARLIGADVDERRFYQRLVAAEPEERAAARREYLTHERDIVVALDEARRATRP
jgi:hypothetical protein